VSGRPICIVADRPNWSAGVNVYLNPVPEAADAFVPAQCFSGSPKPLLPTSNSTVPPARRFPAAHWSVRSYDWPVRSDCDSSRSMFRLQILRHEREEPGRDGVGAERRLDDHPELRVDS
jgi:hypothetical protein